jgi:hypothetical protein
MNRTKTYSLLLIALIGLLGLIGWLLRGNSRDSQPFSPEIEQSTKSPRSTTSSHAVIEPKDPTAALLDAFKTHIELYGKIVDQHGNPVAGATVKLSPVDRPFGDQSNSKMALVSDAAGEFSVKGKQGFAMGVSASKDGYMTLPPLDGPSSSAMLSYGGEGKTGKRYSNPATPLVLTLHEIGPVDPIIYVKNKGWKLAMDGTARAIALNSEKGLGKHQIEFRFKSDWIKLPKNNEMYGKRYDWSLEASIPGGGFLESDSDYKFEAPETGYQETIKIEYSSTMPEGQWKRSEHRRYFVKFSDGSYGRIRFSIDGSSNSTPLDMTSWLNLKPGSRNLSSNDWDPTRVSE